MSDTKNPPGSETGGDEKRPDPRTEPDDYWEDALCRATSDAADRYEKKLADEAREREREQEKKP